MNRGIAMAGNLVVDVIKEIPVFPERGKLVRAESVEYTFGGCVTNTIRDVARLDPAIPLKAAGMIGTDDYGDAVLAELTKYPSIDTRGILREGRTSFCDVLAERESKVRTFVYFAGANARLNRSHIDLSRLDADMLHAGYILLLDGMDAPDAECGTQMARLLRDARAEGMRTSVDVVSEQSDRFSRLVPPSLPYVDILVINEIEAGMTCNIPLRDASDGLILASIRPVLAALRAMGVSDWIIIHAPEGAFGLDRHNRFFYTPGVIVPDGFIAGTVGAGDAFCAGVLAAAWRGRSIEQAMEEGTASAVTSLSAPGASDGVRPLDQALKLIAPMPRRKLSL